MKLVQTVLFTWDNAYNLREQHCPTVICNAITNIKYTYFAEVYMSVLSLSLIILILNVVYISIMLKYVFNVNNGDGNLNCIICVPDLFV